jgi:ribosomal subunit interface protein
MPITISGKHIDIGESLKTFAINEIEKALVQNVGDFIDAYALISREVALFHCELTVHISRALRLRSRGIDPDPYKCVTQAVHLLKQRTRRYKARLRGRDALRKRDAELEEAALSSSSAPSSTSSLSQFILASSSEEETVQDVPLIIAEYPTPLELMSVGDAVMHLDLANLTFFLFKNVATQKVNVVYKRADQNIGWIVLNES